MSLIALEKTRARLQAKAIRGAVTSNHAGASIELINHFPAGTFQNAIIGGFWPMGDEIDILPLMSALLEMGHTIALPAVTRKNHPLEFRRYHIGDALERGPHGTRQPPKSSETLRPNLILMPLLAFTHLGERLGYGGGYYDRTLAKLRESHDVFACGVAYAAQEAQILPTEPHDMRLNGILTEIEFRRF
ncbi:5-formyltetrahydrofolate cyclo-ligase [Robiginitomaculum antarcticum]|uniref:5-formyltetrahydrofolate cyclo-ligase n=1 Tax=Robiginitomaculum antarcticum TaxID=437507 RepID=UPI00036FD852|nr:5-formyltetrahydrofolate cyclo-ligase [Robiginitomaculum antarcticum]